MITFPKIDEDKIYVKDYENGIICQLFGGDGEYYLSNIGSTEFSGSAYNNENDIFSDPRGKWYVLDNLDDYVKFLQGDRNFKRILPEQRKV